MAKVKIVRTVHEEVDIPDEVTALVKDFMLEHQVTSVASPSGVETLYTPISEQEIIELSVKIYQATKTLESYRR